MCLVLSPLVKANRISLPWAMALRGGANRGERRGIKSRRRRKRVVGGRGNDFARVKGEMSESVCGMWWENLTELLMRWGQGKGKIWFKLEGHLLSLESLESGILFCVIYCVCAYPNTIMHQNTNLLMITAFRVRMNNFRNLSSINFIFPLTLVSSVVLWNFAHTVSDVYISHLFRMSLIKLIKLMDNSKCV